MRWVFLATDNIASLTNAHHGRPVFFNLQTNSAAAVGCGGSSPYLAAGASGGRGRLKRFVRPYAPR